MLCSSSSSGAEFHGFMAKLNNKDACIESILMPTRKVLTSNDPAWVISGHNFVVGRGGRGGGGRGGGGGGQGALGLEIRAGPVDNCFTAALYYRGDRTY